MSRFLQYSKYEGRLLDIEHSNSKTKSLDFRVYRKSSVSVKKIDMADIATPENWQEYTTAVFRNQDPAKLQRLDVVPEI